MTEETQTESPRGELTVRVIAMPADTNANGDIFGGWVLSQMDAAGGIAGVERAQGRVVTIKVEAAEGDGTRWVGPLVELAAGVASLPKGAPVLIGIGGVFGAAAHADDGLTANVSLATTCSCGQSACRRCIRCWFSAPPPQMANGLAS